ncbi:unnamed protein product [Ilex paraguariensis]|uniref:Fe2OG dioxygenase domain-containing protein n=1 Tax=Ilex paraguariensis TaxID=185542 RepID=A0ABC8SBD3_9AQUA
MGEVDPSFILPIEHRPQHSTLEAEAIPLIDLSILISPNPNSVDRLMESLIADIGDACKNWGFFQVINHGVPLESRRNLEIAGAKFFGLSEEEKKRVSKDEVNPVGYYNREHTKNVRDWKEVFDFLVQSPTLIPVSHEPDDKSLKELSNRWPENPPELREACEIYAGEVQKLAYKLLELISMSLGLQAKRLNGFFKHQTTYVRLNHYSPCPTPDLVLGVGRHKDSGALTIVAQDDVGGLEVKRKTDGEWFRVKPTPNAYVVNIGDIIQVWSNEKYESVEHRAVVNSERDRFTIPFFLHPAHYTMVEPLEELTDKQHPAKYKAYNWGKFYAARKRGNFRKLEVENIQISHFRVSGKSG